MEDGEQYTHPPANQKVLKYLCRDCADEHPYPAMQRFENAPAEDITLCVHAHIAATTLPGNGISNVWTGIEQKKE